MMSHTEHKTLQKRNHGSYDQSEARGTMRASDIQKYISKTSTELTSSSVKVADSSVQMWQKYSDCRLRDFAHST
jgi:hypothetical protein